MGADELREKLNTMKTKHTPGPLRLGLANGERAIYGPKGEWLATLPSVLESEEVLANARLFIAAPELVSALVQLERLASGLIDQSATHDGLRNCDALANARAAILKAGGAL